MSDIEPEPGPWRGLSFSKIAITAVLAVGFCIGIMVGWLSSPEPEPANTPHAQQAVSAIMQETPPLITNMPVLSEQDADAIKAPEPEPPEPAAPILSPPTPEPATPEPARPQPAAPPPAPPIPAGSTATPEVPAESSAPLPAVHAAKLKAKPLAPKREARSTPEERTGPWAVQLGAFQSEDHAKLLLGTLTAHGHPAEIAPGKSPSGDPLFCVRTGHYPSRAAAVRAAHDLARREKLPTYVIEVPATSG